MKDRESYEKELLGRRYLTHGDETLAVWYLGSENKVESGQKVVRSGSTVGESISVTLDRSGWVDGQLMVIYWSQLRYISSSYRVHSGKI